MMSKFQWNIRVLSVTDFFAALIFHIPVWVAFELQYISLGQLAVIEAIIQGSQLLFELPTGALADLWGKRMTVVIGRALMAIGLLFYARSRTFPDFVVAALFFGISDAFVSGAKDALIYDTLKEEGKEHLFPRVLSRGSFIFQSGLAIATLTGGFLSLWGYTAAIYASAIAFFVSTVGSLLYKEPVVDTEKFTLRSYVRQTRMGFKEIFKTQYVGYVSLFYILVGGVTWAAMMIFNTSLLTTVGYSTLEIGIVVAIIRVINGFILFRALHLETVITKSRVYVMVPLFMILCYLPGIFLSKEAVVVAVAISIFLSASRWVILGGYVNEHYESKNRATALSTLSMAVSICVVLLALVSGPVMNAFGGVKAMFTLLGLVSLFVVLPLGFRIRRRYHS